MELTKRTIKTIKRNGTIDRGRIRADIVTMRLQDEGHHNTRHVLPGKQRGWDVKKGGSGKVIQHFDTKDQAVDFARQIAQNQGVELVIHKRDGTVQSINSYVS